MVRNQEEALLKERHLDKIHQPSVGGRNIDLRPDPQMDLKNQMQLLMFKNNKIKMMMRKVFRLLQHSGKSKRCQKENLTQ